MRETLGIRPVSRWTKASLVAAAMLALAAVVTVPADAAEERGQGGKDCSNSSIGATPLVDLGADAYQGAQGGLYPEGSNQIPDAHLAVGLSRAAAITPRDAAGNPDPDGAIVFASIGMSNTFREFSRFERVIAATPNVDPSVVVVNAAQGGRDLSAWIDRGNRAWEGLDTALAGSGVTAAQVQAVWIKVTDRVSAGGPPPFPDDALTFRDEMTELLGYLQEDLPNLQVAYLSSRIYGGYNTVSSPSPEPLAYEEGFGVKWIIEDQMNGDPALAADPEGDPRVPWIAWGPYLWADGTTPRGDGLTWDCRDIRGDGVHPVDSGNEKVAAALLDFLATDPTTAWMWTDRSLPDPPADPGDIAPPSTIAGDTTTTTPTDTTSADPTTTVDRTDDENPTTTTRTPNTDEEAAATDTTVAPVAAADDDDSPVPPVAWMLLGAGLALALASGVGWLLTRRR